jgi:MFS family permease
MLDRVGNKPALTLSGILFVAHFLGWACVAAKLAPPSYFVLAYQIITCGLAYSLWNLANVRIVMGIVPAMGRTHFLALYSVAASMAVGLLPLAWGWVIDALSHWNVRWGYWEWNSFSVFYLFTAATMVVALVLLRGVAEPVKMTWDAFARELLFKTPSRALSRLIVRMRGPGIG